MSKRKLEAKEWLKEVGFADADVDAMASKFTAVQLEKIAEGTMRQEDYDRAMNDGKSDLDRLQNDLRATESRLNDEMLAWGELKNKDTQKAAEIQARFETEQQNVLRLTQTIQRVATAAGMDPMAVLAEAQVTPVTNPNPAPAPAPAANLDGYVKSDQFTTGLDNIATIALRTPAALMKISREHHALTGEDLDGEAIVNEIMSRAGTRGNQKSLDPIRVWEEMHGIPAKRVEAQRKAHDAEISAAERRGAEAALSQANIPGAHTPAGRTPSPLNLGNRTSVLQRPQPGMAVNAAVSALRSGKYRPGTKSA